jgi:hypothetical protein
MISRTRATKSWVSVKSGSALSAGISGNTGSNGSVSRLGISTARCGSA